MKKLALSLMILTIISASCVTSLQPLATYQSAIRDDRVTGTWNADGKDYTVQKFYSSDFFKKLKKEADKNKPGEEEPLTQKEAEDSILYSKSYVVKYTKDNVEYHMFGTMVKLNGQYFMNFTPADINTNKENEQAFEITLTDRLATHTIARIKFTNANSIQLDFIDGDFLYKQVKAGRMKIKNEADDLYDTFMITASTSELQQFLEKYGNDERFFSKGNSVTLIRKS